MSNIVSGTPDSARKGLVNKVREEVMEAPPTMRHLNVDANRQNAAAATFNGPSGHCAKQVYDAQVDQQQADLIVGLEQRLQRAKLQQRQALSAEEMTSNQITMLQSSLQMLLSDDAVGGPTTLEDRHEHDDLTAHLSRQLANLEDAANTHRATKTRLDAEIAMVNIELKQRKSARLRVTEDVERTLAALIKGHAS